MLDKDLINLLLYYLRTSDFRRTKLNMKIPGLRIFKSSQKDFINYYCKSFSFNQQLSYALCYFNEY